MINYYYRYCYRLTKSRLRRHDVVFVRQPQDWAYMNINCKCLFVISICIMLALPVFADIPFPRLGMWWLDAEEEPAEKIAGYDLLLNEFEFENGIEKIAAIRQLNPRIKIFRPISPTEINWFIDGIENPVIGNLPSDFFLLKIGTVLAAPVDKDETKIRVSELYSKEGFELFRKGNTIAIGESESALILGIDRSKNILTVKRGHMRSSAAHGAGERISEHVTFWPDTWVMNNTADCARKNIRGFNERLNWLEFYFTLISVKDHPLIPENPYNIDQDNLFYDGIIIDRFEDRQSWLGEIIDDEQKLISLDLLHDNNPVSREKFDASWMKGTDAMLDLLMKKYPGLAVIRNNCQSVRFDRYNGQVYETSGWSKPDAGWWEKLFVKNWFIDYYPVASYLEWFSKGKKPLYVMMEVYEDERMPDNAGNYTNPFEKPGFKPDYRKMRFSLASTLMGDGYYSYEANTSTHGSGGLLWFDEYDNAGKGKGYLGRPVSECRKTDNGIYIREFENGIVCVNPQSKETSVYLGKKYRKINGQQVREVNDGSLTDKVKLKAFDGIIMLKE